MALYDIYAPYRQPLTDSELDYVEEARAFHDELERQTLADPDMTKAPGGYLHRTEGFRVDPLVRQHMNIAMKRAEAQFRDWPDMPEDADISLRYPGVDPVGKFSIIDMKFEQRKARIAASLESRSPDVQFYAQRLLVNITPGNFKLDLLRMDVAALARKHRTLTRASKLCLDPNGCRFLHEESRELEADPLLVQYDKYLQGVEYAAGVRTGPVPEDVKSWYRETLGHELDLNMIKEAETLYHVPREIHVEFQNLENKLLQHRFANPRSWGAPPPEQGAPAIEAEEAAGIVPPYARATAERVIDPIFQQAEKMGMGDMPLNRGDLIIVDGKTIREKMFEDYYAAGQPVNDFEKFYQKNLKQMTSEYVAAGLMAGKRVEAFIPDKNGRIPDEPVQITKTGFEPSPLKKVTLNAWERFFSKRGFFKEKVVKAAEYERMQAARERVKTNNLLTRLSLENGVQRSIKDQFFADWTRENGPLPDNLPNNYISTRSAVTSIAMCALATAGYPVADILDPTKLQAEKLQMGSETCRQMTAGNQRWIAEALFRGQNAIMDFVDETCRTINVQDEKQLFSEQGKQIFAAIYVAFDANQECKHCKKELQEVAASYHPGRGEEALQEMFDRVLPASTFFRHAQEGMKSRLQLAGGMSENPRAALRDVINYEAARRSYAETAKASPRTPISKQYTMATYEKFFDCGGMVMPTQAFEDVTNSLEKSPEIQRGFGQSLMAGRMQKRLMIKNDPQRGFDFKLDGSSVANIIKEEQASILQRTAQKNAAAPAPRVK